MPGYVTLVWPAGALLVAGSGGEALDRCNFGSFPAWSRIAVYGVLPVMRLRKALGDDGCRVITQPPGYLISVDPGELDLTRFRAVLGVEAALDL
jgi:hypothetical protein